MKSDKAIANTIFGLCGVLIGAYLITKLVRKDGTQKTLSKKDGIGELDRKSVQKVSEIDINKRQKKILEILSEKGSLTVKDLVAHFPEISTRTLRRDMDALIRFKVASQEGSTKSTYYKYLLT